MGEANGNGVIRWNHLAIILPWFIVFVSGMLAWGNLKGDVREGFARIEGRVGRIEDRVDRLEDTATGRRHAKGR